MMYQTAKPATKLRTKFLRGAALTILSTAFGSALNANAYDVCADDITNDETSCVHETMAAYGHDVYRLNPFPGNTGTFVGVEGVMFGAGHEDEKDHIRGRTGGSLTVGHFWDPDPLGVIFFPDNQPVLDGIAGLLGAPLNNWQKSQAYWSRALGEAALGDNAAARHQLGHVVHHMGDNTVPTHAHVTSHAPGNRDAYENWMSNKYHVFTGALPDLDFRVETDTNHHLLSAGELADVTKNYADYLDQVGRMDPMKYADLTVNIPQVAGATETPLQKLLWLQYTTNQIAEFFAGDRDEGQALDPVGWVQEDLNKMLAANLRPTTEDQMDNNDSCDCDGPEKDLSNIRKYSYIRGLRAIGGLYNLFEQTVKTEPILSVSISKLRIHNDSTSSLSDPNDICDDFSAAPACEAFAIVDIGGLTGRNQGDLIEIGDGVTKTRSTWNWGNTVRDASASSSSTSVSFVTIQIKDEDINEDDDIDISAGPFSALSLLVDTKKCSAGEAGAITSLFDPGFSKRCGTTITSSAQEDNQGTAGATITFSIDISDNNPPEVNCAAPDGFWHDDNVEIVCTAEDFGSGLRNPADASFTLTTSVPDGLETGDAVTNTRQICDVKNNCITAGPVFGNKVDRKAPVIDIVEPMATEYVHSATLTLNYGVTDGGSGVKSVSPTLNNEPTFAGTDLLSGESINLLTALPLGMHNFTVNADDQVDNVSDPASVEFSIIVTPESIIDALKQFEASGDIDRHLVNSLNVKLRTARGKRSQQQCKTSNKIYGAFINELQAQSGKKVTVFAADILIADAIYLIDNCNGNR